MIKHSGNKWIVTDSSGEQILGTHESKTKAIRQIQAIEASKEERKQQNEHRIVSFSTFLEENGR
jgi:hypothetical protein